MPVGSPKAEEWRDQLIRRVRVVRGEVRFRLCCHPAFDYARAGHETVVEKGGACFHSPSLSLGLASEVPLDKDERGVTAEFTLHEGQTVTFVLRPVEPGSGCGAPVIAGEIDELFRQTVAYWRRWLSACTYHGPLARDGPPLGPGAQAAHLRAHGRHRRRAHVQPARAPRRRAQLGLPLHLDPRRGVHPLRPPAHRLHRGGGALHELARRPLRRSRSGPRPLQIVYGIDGRRGSRRS